MEMSNPCTADPCDTHKCPAGLSCRVFKPTGEAYCEPSCDLDNGGCAANETCTIQSVQCIRAPCPSTVQCTPSKYMYKKNMCVCACVCINF